MKDDRVAINNRADAVKTVHGARLIELLCQKVRQRWPHIDKHHGWSLRDLRLTNDEHLETACDNQLRIAFEEFTNRIKLVAEGKVSNGSTVVYAEARLYPLALKQFHALGDSILRMFDGDSISVNSEPFVSLACNRGTGEALTKLHLRTRVGEDSSTSIFSPMLLEACFQSALILAGKSDQSYGLTSLDSIQIFGKAKHRVVCYSRLVVEDNSSIVVDFDLADEAGTIFASLKGLHYLHLF